MRRDLPSAIAAPIRPPVSDRPVLFIYILGVFLRRDEGAKRSSAEHETPIASAPNRYVACSMTTIKAIHSRDTQERRRPPDIETPFTGRVRVTFPSRGELDSVGAMHLSSTTVSTRSKCALQRTCRHDGPEFREYRVIVGIFRELKR